jgi:hypothetical protein
MARNGTLAYLEGAEHTSFPRCNWAFHVAAKKTNQIDHVT